MLVPRHASPALFDAFGGGRPIRASHMLADIRHERPIGLRDTCRSSHRLPLRSMPLTKEVSLY
jgi:hypothetical protein